MNVAQLFSALMLHVISILDVVLDSKMSMQNHTR